MVVARRAAAPLRLGGGGLRWTWLTDLKIGGPLVSLLVLGVLVVLPLVTMLVASLRPAGTLPFDHAPVILDNFVNVFTAPDTLPMLRNTALYAIVPIFIARRWRTVGETCAGRQMEQVVHTRGHDFNTCRPAQR
jgi:hypothetical protein